MPFGPYKDFADCVRKNQDKDDPEAYCASIEREIEEAEGMTADWTGVIAIEGLPTGDGRMLENGSLYWETLPIPLIWDRDEGDHSGMVVGSVTNIWRGEDGRIEAEGNFVDSEDDNLRAAVNTVRDLLADGAVGVSVGLDSETVEWRVDPDLLPEDIADAIAASGVLEWEIFTPIVASLGGDPSLPVAPADRPWSGAAARNRVFEAATSGDGDFNIDLMRRAFLWQDPDADPQTKQAWKLGVADMVDNKLTIIPRGVAAAAAGRGVGAVDGLSDMQRKRVEARVCRLYDRIRETHNEWNDCPFNVQMETLARMSHDDQLAVVMSARVRHLAIVDTPAIADARIGIVAAGGDMFDTTFTYSNVNLMDVTPSGGIEFKSVGPVSSPPSSRKAAPPQPVGPAADPSDFANPNFGQTNHDDPRLAIQTPERPGEAVTYGAPLTVLDDGRVFGHAALWGRCHSGFRNRCVVPPRGAEYSRFLHGEAVPGVRTGPLTVGTTHARLEWDALEAMNHYSNTGRAVADVAVGEDHLGLWVSGRLRPKVTDALVADLRGSSISGDWRPVNGRYRLCGLLAVNQPGYLVQRSSENGAVITAGPCSCDTTDPISDIYDRLAVIEKATAQLLGTGL